MEIPETGPGGRVALVEIGGRVKVRVRAKARVRKIHIAKTDPSPKEVTNATKPGIKNLPSATPQARPPSSTLTHAGFRLYRPFVLSNQIVDAHAKTQPTFQVLLAPSSHTLPCTSSTLIGDAGIARACVGVQRSSRAPHPHGSSHVPRPIRNTNRPSTHRLVRHHFSSHLNSAGA